MHNEGESVGELDPSIHQRGSALIHFAYRHLLEVSVWGGREIRVHFNCKQKSKTTLKAPIDLAQCFSNLSISHILGGQEKKYAWLGPSPELLIQHFGMGMIFYISSSQGILVSLFWGQILRTTDITQIFPSEQGKVIFPMYLNKLEMS